MSPTELITKINQGIHDNYSHRPMMLTESGENMRVPLSRYDTDLVIIRPKDDERDIHWACFSDEVERNIADYIVFKAIGNEVICFILELKKSKTNHNVTKATNQILSTHPLVKMIYEKTTGENAKNLKTIGIRVFGTGNKAQAKVSKAEKLKLPDSLAKENEHLAIGHFLQNTQSENLTSLSNFYVECKRIFTN
ncbi:MAG: hypothetical protein M0R39_06705 [Prolixibacteraceae bacterium]|nr:hypothetical protein [Prolixibacteraceae bacterium]